MSEVIENPTTEVDNPPAPANPTDTEHTGVGNEPKVEEPAKEKPSILGGEKPPAEPPAAEQEVKYDFGKVMEELNVTLDEEANGEFEALLREAGVKDNETAEKFARLGIQYGLAQIENYQYALNERLYKEAVEAYGGTVDNPGEKFEEAKGKAATALQAIEKVVPGIRAALDDSGVDCDVRMVQMFAALADLVGEDGNLMTGGAGVSVGKESVYKTDLTKY
jgi:hypothetical protein